MEEKGAYEKRKPNCGTQIKDSLVVIVCGDVDTKGFGRTVQEEGLECGCQPEQEGCRIEIKDSKVVILCGDVDLDKVKKCLTEVFDEAKDASQE